MTHMRHVFFFVDPRWHQFFLCVLSRVGEGWQGRRELPRWFAMCKVVSVIAARSCGCVDKDIASRYSVS